MEKYLKEHLKKYPLMEVEDILKLYFQGILGPGHLINDYDIALYRVEQEYQQIKNENFNHDLVEEISDEYVRIYLLPYRKSHSDFSMLVDAFMKSTKEPTDIFKFVQKVKDLREICDKKKIDDYLEKGDYLISHSHIYKNNYHPHYLVIHKKYLSQVLD